MRNLFYALALGGIALPWAAQAQEAAATFYQGDRLYSATSNQRPQLMGENLVAKSGRLAKASEVVYYPSQVSSNLQVPADWVFFQGLKSPHEAQWAYLERTQIGSDFNLWLFNPATGAKQLLFDQKTSPAPGYALKPIAWSANRNVLYLEALQFDSGNEHEGIWAYDVATRSAQQLKLDARYFDTPVLSPDRQRLLYPVSTSAERDMVHGFADEVASFDLNAKAESVLMRQPGVPVTVAGWAESPLKAADLVPVENAAQATREAAAAVAAPPTDASATAAGVNYYLPWDAGRVYYVSRTGTPVPTGAHYPSGAANDFGVYNGFTPHGYMAIDFDTPDNRDDIVRASAPGTVTSLQGTSISGGYGNLVIVTHSNGYRTYYAHNKSFIARVGQVVQTGDPLSIEGTTGRSNGDHIHFEFRTPGGAQRYIGTFSDAASPTGFIRIRRPR